MAFTHTEEHCVRGQRLTKLPWLPRSLTLSHMHTHTQFWHYFMLIDNRVCPERSWTHGDDSSYVKLYTHPGDGFLIFNCPDSESLCPLEPQILVLGWLEWNLKWPSAVVAHMTQD